MTVAVNLSVGDPPPDEPRPFWGKCWTCGHCWVVCYLPMVASKAAKLMGKAACPKGCGGKVGIAKQDEGMLLDIPEPQEAV